MQDQAQRRSRGRQRRAAGAAPRKACSSRWIGSWSSVDPGGYASAPLLVFRRELTKSAPPTVNNPSEIVANSGVCEPVLASGGDVVAVWRSVVIAAVPVLMPPPVPVAAEPVAVTASLGCGLRPTPPMGCWPRGTFLKGPGYASCSARPAPATVVGVGAPGTTVAVAVGVGTAATVGVAVATASPVGVTVGVAVGSEVSAVAVGVGVDVGSEVSAVAVGVGVDVGNVPVVAVAVAVGAVTTAVAVAVAVGAVTTAVAVGVGVGAVTTAVAVAVAVGAVTTAVAVGVAVGAAVVAVGVAVGTCTTAVAVAVGVGLAVDARRPASTVLLTWSATTIWVPALPSASTSESTASLPPTSCKVHARPAGSVN